ncbi:MAG: 3'(2'),5'-bisphosphate nucleotidase CysQ [Campylobacterota bacterium]
MQYRDINIEYINKIAIKAGEAIMEIYSQDFDVEYKDDNSPLTKADKVSNQIICDRLKELYPNIPIMSEENKQTDYEQRKEWTEYFCIDPIDGTKEFIKKNDEFTVNIAIIYENRPVLGVVYAPALGDLYYAKENEGAYLEVLGTRSEVLSKNKLPITTQKNLKEKTTVVASKSHLSNETQEFIDNLALNTEHLTLVSKGSSLKLCMVAAGEADVYPRLAPTMEWDTAAADAVVRQSGKQTLQYKTDKEVVYNKQDLLNPWFIVK